MGQPYISHRRDNLATLGKCCAETTSPLRVNCRSVLKHDLHGLRESAVATLRSMGEMGASRNLVAAYVLEVSM